MILNINRVRWADGTMAHCSAVQIMFFVFWTMCSGDRPMEWNGMHASVFSEREKSEVRHKGDVCSVCIEHWKWFFLFCSSWIRKRMHINFGSLNFRCSTAKRLWSKMLRNAGHSGALIWMDGPELSYGRWLLQRAKRHWPTNETLSSN